MKNRLGKWRRRRRRRRTNLFHSSITISATILTMMGRNQKRILRNNSWNQKILWGRFHVMDVRKALKRRCVWSDHFIKLKERSRQKIAIRWEFDILIRHISNYFTLHRCGCTHGKELKISPTHIILRYLDVNWHLGLQHTFFKLSNLFLDDLRWMNIEHVVCFWIWMDIYVNPKMSFEGQSNIL